MASAPRRITALQQTTVYAHQRLVNCSLGRPPRPSVPTGSGVPQSLKTEARMAQAFIRMNVAGRLPRDKTGAKQCRVLLNPNQLAPKIHPADERGRQSAVHLARRNHHAQTARAAHRVPRLTDRQCPRWSQTAGKVYVRPNRTCRTRAGAGPAHAPGQSLPALVYVSQLLRRINPELPGRCKKRRCTCGNL